MKPECGTLLTSLDFTIFLIYWIIFWFHEFFYFLDFICLQRLLPKLKKLVKLQMYFMRSNYWKILAFVLFPDQDLVRDLTPTILGKHFIFWWDMYFTVGTLQKFGLYDQINCLEKHFKIFPYFMYTKTQSCFFHFSFCATLFFP